MELRQVLAISALLAVTTCLPALSDLRHDVLGERRAAHHFDNHVDVLAVEHVAHVRHDRAARRQREVTRLARVAHAELRNLHRDPKVVPQENRHARSQDLRTPPPTVPPPTMPTRTADATTGPWRLGRTSGGARAPRGSTTANAASATGSSIA